MTQWELIHISSWPCIWPIRRLNNPSQASGGTGEASANILAKGLRSAAHYFEAKCFGIMCSGSHDKMAIKTICRQTFELSPRGVTMFLDPSGTPVQGVTVTESTREQQTREFVFTERAVLITMGWTDIND
ncbi:hypothetical protein AnigIFM60653_011332 [Aspergillus niger]|nr:hypothetical protein AnigIFM50267_006709 [Aspergillus niger]GLA09253.1 hypothetical protein AnigIFM60653_011332 [Aspergillus niger]